MEAEIKQRRLKIFARIVIASIVTISLSIDIFEIFEVSGSQNLEDAVHGVHLAQTFIQAAFYALSCFTLIHLYHLLTQCFVSCDCDQGQIEQMQRYLTVFICSYGGMACVGILNFFLRICFD